MELLEGSLPEALKLLGESLPKVLPNDPSQLALLHNNRIPTPLFEQIIPIYIWNFIESDQCIIYSLWFSWNVMDFLSFFFYFPSSLKKCLVTAKHNLSLSLSLRKFSFWSDTVTWILWGPNAQRGSKSRHSPDLGIPAVQNVNWTKDSFHSRVK